MGGLINMNMAIVSEFHKLKYNYRLEIMPKFRTFKLPSGNLELSNQKQTTYPYKTDPDRQKSPCTCSCDASLGSDKVYPFLRPRQTADSQAARRNDHPRRVGCRGE